MDEEIDNPQETYLPELRPLTQFDGKEKTTLLYDGVLFEVGKKVLFGGREYEIANFKHFPHGWMVGIYDERPHNNHIDFLNPSGLKVV